MIYNVMGNVIWLLMNLGYLAAIQETHRRNVIFVSWPNAGANWDGLPLSGCFCSFRAWLCLKAGWMRRIRDYSDWVSADVWIQLHLHAKSPDRFK